MGQGIHLDTKLFTGGPPRNLIIFLATPPGQMSPAPEVGIVGACQGCPQSNYDTSLGSCGYAIFYRKTPQGPGVGPGQDPRGSQQPGTKTTIFQ